MGGKWLYQVGLFHNIVIFPIARGKLEPSVSIKWIVADDVCYV